MFTNVTKFIRNIFAGDGGTKVINNAEGFGGLKETDTMTARINDLVTHFELVNKNNKTIATYSRARDARRGALRRGLTLVA